MSTITEKLYPPVINGTLPAFYKENGTVKITVPFSMNKGVNSQAIGGFSLKLKTIQTNKVVAILPSDSESTTSLLDRQVTFILEDTSKIRIGQFLKAQLAYVDTLGNVGYYSTVGVIKYTDKPTVYIENLGSNSNEWRPFLQSYTGVYQTGSDKSERPYSYNFSLYDRYNQLVESSGWLLHNTTINNVASESLSLDVTTDTYVFKTQLIVDEEYYLQYTVRTINDMEISSPLYPCLEPLIGPPTFLVDLKAENIFDEGYINLSFNLNEHRFFDITVEEIIEKYRINNNPVDTREYPNTNKIGEIHVLNDDNNTEFIIQIIYNKSGDEGTIPVRYEIQDPVSREIREAFNKVEESSVSIEVCRAEKTDNFKSWKTIQKVYLPSYQYAINKWSFKDFTIEQGITYKYCFRQYNESNIHSDRSFSNIVMADFEDMFLWDGKKQLKIRFNPQVSSFKTTQLEQKTETLGSKYPFIFKNGQVNYKEFSISGLISYLMDNNEMFVNYQDDLNILSRFSAARENGTPVNQSLPDTAFGESWEMTETLNSVGYNMQAERRFKLKLLDWLNNGEIKMFKSPAEGNYFVQLLNVSLSPENTLSRMLHNFSCTAYEVEEFSYNNLIDLGFLTAVNESQINLSTKTVSLRELISNTFPEDMANNKINLSYAIKVNSAPIFEYLRVDKSTNTNNQSIYLRFGTNENSKVEINDTTFTWNVNDKDIPDIYFCPSDYLPKNDTRTKRQQINDIKTLVGNTQVTYQYYETAETIGNFYNLQDIYFQNIIETLVGPTQKTFNPTSVITQNGSGQTKEVVKFYTLNFQPKAEQRLFEQNGKYFNSNNQEIKQFDKLSIYRIFDNNNHQTKILYLNSNNEIIITQDEDPDTTVILISLNGDSQEETYNLKDLPPNVNLGQRFYKSISLGYGAYVECAYQEKVIVYKN